MAECGQRTEALASPGRLLEMQDLGIHIIILFLIFSTVFYELSEVFNTLL